MQSRPPISRVVISLGGGFSIDDQPLTAQFPDVTFESVLGQDLADAMVEADAALVGFVNAREALQRATRLVWLQTAGAGVERIVDGGFGERNVILTNGSGVMAPNMAEHAIGLMLAFARNLPKLLKAQDSHQWRSGVGIDNVFELAGQTVVLVGMGDIGQQIAERLAAFGMNVIGVRRLAQSGPLPIGVHRIEPIDALDQVLPQAHHVISSVPHTAATVGMFNEARFERFRDGAYFYNLGRATSVVQPDLIAALESGKLGGAGLDVTDPEPLPEDDPLWDVPNVIITGHTSGQTPYFVQRVLDLFTENLRRYRAGEPMLNVVDVARGY